MSDHGSELDFDREIRVRLAFAAVAAVLGIGVAVFTDIPEWVAFAVVVLLGIVAPRTLLYLEG